MMTVRWDWVLTFYLLAGWPLAALVHEAGHVLVGWLQGHRGPRIRLGNRRGRWVVRSRLGPVQLLVYPGIGIWLSIPICWFEERRPEGPGGRFLLAMGGPLASLACWLALWPAGVPLLSVPALRYMERPTLLAAVAWWSWWTLLWTLIPIRYPGTNLDSDGLVAIRSLLAWAKKGRGSDHDGS